MDIRNYAHIISETTFPILFILFVIICEFLFLKWKDKPFSFKRVFSNFAVLFIGTTLFSLFTRYVLTREEVVTFAESHALIKTSFSWTMFFVWLVIFDFINYWTHVLYHRSSFFWMFHAVHHSDKNLDASTTIRVSFVNSFFTITAYAFVAYLGVNIHLIPAIIQTIFLQQVILHSFLFRSFELPLLSKFFVTPSMHAIHHTETHNHKNYGFVFSVWDKWFTSSQMFPYQGQKFGIVSLSSSCNPFIIHFEPIFHFLKTIKEHMWSK